MATSVASPEAILRGYYALRRWADPECLLRATRRNVAGPWRSPYLNAIAAWLESHEIPAPAATRYVGSVFAGLAESTRSAEPSSTSASPCNASSTG
jgi:hypothetical protein